MQNLFEERDKEKQTATQITQNKIILGKTRTPVARFERAVLRQVSTNRLTEHF